jgi:hypothetical protein
VIPIQYVNMRNQIYVSFSSSISVVLGYRIGENKKRGMQNEEESTGCTSEWEFSRYVLSNVKHCFVLSSNSGMHLLKLDRK